MSTIAIQADRLTKRYALGGRDAYGALRDSIARAAQAPVRAMRQLAGQAQPRSPRRTWIAALDHVSFEVAQGEIVGIVGRNGSGKSTLLKVLARITDPTAGKAVVRGRVGSLLEVGTGFHPELTGRENVFLNGAILGMRRAEIRRKFDEIVAFAEVESFVDTVVKHYSSGMQMRLAVAVAAHLDACGSNRGDWPPPVPRPRCSAPTRRRSAEARRARRQKTTAPRSRRNS